MESPVLGVLVVVIFMMAGQSAGVKQTLWELNSTQIPLVLHAQYLHPNPMPEPQLTERAGWFLARVMRHSAGCCATEELRRATYNKAWIADDIEIPAHEDWHLTDILITGQRPDLNPNFGGEVIFYFFQDQNVTQYGIPGVHIPAEEPFLTRSCIIALDTDNRTIMDTRVWAPKSPGDTRNFNVYRCVLKEDLVLNNPTDSPKTMWFSWTYRNEQSYWVVRAAVPDISTAPLNPPMRKNPAAVFRGKDFFIYDDVVVWDVNQYNYTNYGGQWWSMRFNEAVFEDPKTLPVDYAARDLELVFILLGTRVFHRPDPSSGSSSTSSGPVSITTLINMCYQGNASTFTSAEPQPSFEQQVASCLDIASSSVTYTVIEEDLPGACVNVGADFAVVVRVDEDAEAYLPDNLQEVMWPDHGDCTWQDAVPGVEVRAVFIGAEVTPGDGSGSDGSTDGNASQDDESESGASSHCSSSFLALLF